MKPVTVSTHQIQGAWLEVYTKQHASSLYNNASVQVWQEAQEIAYSINEAKDVPTLKVFGTIEVNIN